MSIALDGRVAVVTGAGNGLGRLYALELAARGAAVVVNDLARDDTGWSADRVVTEIRDAGGRAVPDHNTVATPEGGHAIVESATSAFGSLDVVVANAGVARRGRFEDLSVDDVRLALAVNLEGAMWVTKAALPRLKAQGYGRIVLATSAAGIYGHGVGANYCAAKGGVVGLLRALAIEGVREGVRTNAVSPFAYTGMTIDTPGMTDELKERLDPGQVAPVVVYLASEACEVNGQIFSAAGGTVARVFSSTTRGWRAAPGTFVTAESVSEHLQEIMDPAGAAMPTKVVEEVRHLLESDPG